VAFPEGSQFIVKQERFQFDGETLGEFYREWRVQTLIQKFPELACLRLFVPEVHSFDAKNSILVVRYLKDYADLANFYRTEKQYPSEIGSGIGNALATLHCATYQRSLYRDFLMEGQSEGQSASPHFSSIMDEITPEVFSGFCADGIEFFRLIQRYDSLKQAIVTLDELWQASCLIHKDFRFFNILVHREWAKHGAPEQTTQSLIKIIDWERFIWGDPAYDLAIILASYLNAWIESLLINPAIPLEVALRLAFVPLEALQPTMVALVQAYLNRFPEMLQQRPTFVETVMQFTGFYLIDRMQLELKNHLPFNNQRICKLQIAKRLLCNPESSIPHIFGVAKETLSMGIFSNSF
jgi:hypothetical protein